MKNSLLTKQEIFLIPEKILGWEVSGNKIRREWHFQNFIEAFSFITKVALLSEKLQHHPELSNVYSFVKIELTTHDLGGISNLDIKLATEINNI